MPAPVPVAVSARDELRIHELPRGAIRSEPMRSEAVLRDSSDGVGGGRGRGASNYNWQSRRPENREMGGGSSVHVTSKNRIGLSLGGMVAVVLGFGGAVRAQTPDADRIPVVAVA